MKLPKITNFNIKNNEILFRSNDIIVSKDKNGLSISSMKEKKTISTTAEQWYLYGLHISTPMNAKNITKKIINYCDSQTDFNNFIFSPKIFKIKHLKSGFFSCKNNFKINPEVNKNKKFIVSHGWSKDGGGMWNSFSNALIHIYNKTKMAINPSNYISGKEYYSYRNISFQEYAILAMDNDGNHKEYWAKNFIIKREINRKWIDYTKWKIFLSKQSKSIKKNYNFLFEFEIK